MPCLNDYDYEVLLQHITYAQAEDFIREKYWEVYYFEPGYRVLGLRLLGDTAVPVAVEAESDDTLVFPYTKPCMGTFVLRFGGVADEVKRIRSSYSKSLTLGRYADASGKKREAVAITCPMDVSLRNFNYDIMSHFRTFKECEAYIREKFKDIYYCEPDFKVLGLKPLGKDYITVAIEDNNENIVFPFYDSGMGALIIRIKGVPDEVVRVKENYSRALTEKKLREPPGSPDAEDAAAARGKRKGRSTLSKILGRNG
ncbi:MAG: DUF1894 domain-containing protein [Methanocella sp.]